MENIVPHYEKAPITGKNLHALVRSYFSEYRPTEAKYFETYAGGLITHLAKYDEYNDYCMDTIESFCQKAKPCIERIHKPGLGTSYSQFFILEIIIMAFVKTRTGGYAGQLEGSEKLKKCLETSSKG